MRLAVAPLLASLLLVPAAAGTSRVRPAVALTASPARVLLAGSGDAAIRVTNPGGRPIVVDASRAGFSLDLHGRPHVAPVAAARAAAGWLTLRPSRLTLGSGESATLTVAARLPGDAEPGDHDALVLLTTRPQRDSSLAVRMRVGVVVVVRAPGRIVHGLAVGAVHVRRHVRGRMLELLVANRGNVTETLARQDVEVALVRDGRVAARLRSPDRELRPRTRGILEIPYSGRMAGWATLRVTISGHGERLRRSFRARL